ncbi:cell division protein FtsA [candidate division KSB1 bacterium]|nr:cell division protein FtsA [candidate division KSB1 bacterium]
MANSDIVAALDIGTTKIGAIIAEIEDYEEPPKIIGVGNAPSHGLKKGVVVNIEKTVQSIDEAVKQAENMAGVEIDSVVVGIAGDHIRSINGRGVVAVSGPDNEITDNDIRRVIDAAKAVVLPIDREIIHILPQEYIVDEQRGIPDPLGMSGVRLEAEVHIVTGAVTSAQNIYRCVERSGLNVLDLVLQPLASSHAVLSDEEKELGVVVLDLGGGTTDIAMFFEGCIRHTGIVALGGGAVTNDLALCLRTPIEQAEQIKIKYGAVLHSNIDANEAVEIPGVGGRPSRRVSRGLLIDIVQPRMEEILSLAHSEMKKSEFANMMTSGVVLTGGASLIHGLSELAEEIFDLPVKLGYPSGFRGLVDLARSPIYATAIGLIFHHLKNQDDFISMTDANKKDDFGIIDRMKSWLGLS